MLDAAETQESSARDAHPQVFDLTLGPELTIAQASEQHQRLLESLQTIEAGTLRLDLSSVSDFDSAAIQLLLATQRSLQDKGASLQLHQASPVVLAALNCYGLDACLQPLQQATSSAPQPQE